MYPLNLTKAATAAAPAGFALASDEAEHEALSAQGFEPKFVPSAAVPEPDGDEPASKEDVMAALDAAGITYDKRSGIAKLKALLPQ